MTNKQVPFDAAKVLAAMTQL